MARNNPQDHRDVYERIRDHLPAYSFKQIEAACERMRDQGLAVQTYADARKVAEALAALGYVERGALKVDDPDEPAPEIIWVCERCSHSFNRPELSSGADPDCCEACGFRFLRGFPRRIIGNDEAAEEYAASVWDAIHTTSLDI